MRIIATCAAGWIGSAVVAATGAEVLHGDLDDLEASRAGAPGCERVLHLELPTASRPAEDSGFLGPVRAVDQPAPITVTRDLPGWRPEQPGLLDDLDHGHHFT